MMQPDEYWIPASTIDEARLVRVLAEMVKYFLATAALAERGDALSIVEETTDEKPTHPIEHAPPS